MVAPSFTLNSIRPYFEDLTAASKSSAFTKVPDLTFGMRPFGPKTLAKVLRPCMCSGVAIILSKFSVPSPISFMSLSSPIRSAPASFIC